MRAFFVTLGLLGIVFTAGNAQTPPPGAPAPEAAATEATAATAADPHAANVARHLDFLAKHLGLTDEQRARLVPILRQEADEAAGVYAQPDSVAHPREIARVRKQAVERICPLLTPEQRETLLTTRRGEYLD